MEFEGCQSQDLEQSCGFGSELDFWGETEGEQVRTPSQTLQWSCGKKIEPVDDLQQLEG